MNRMIRIIIVALVAAVVSAVFAYKINIKEATKTKTPAKTTIAARIDETAQKSSADAALPRLLDLGSHNCIPCKMMMPILDELKTEYAGKLKIEFIDVRENPSAGDKYNIEAIPTQIFFDAAGKELFRHVGFYPKAEILKKWRELGIAAQNQNEK